MFSLEEKLSDFLNHLFMGVLETITWVINQSLKWCCEKASPVPIWKMDEYGKGIE